MPEPSAAHIRAVLFDLDGTLLDTLADIARSANEVLEEQGFPAHPLDAYRQFIGDGVGNLFRRAFPEGAAMIPTWSPGAWRAFARLMGGAGTWRRGLFQEFPTCWTAS